MPARHRWRRLVLGALIAVSPAFDGAAAGAPRPNIVVVMTDDAGYSDLGCYGGEIPTPNVDALARQGIRFTKFYTNARCSPTRASLMTGMYPHRVGVGELCDPPFETPFAGYKRSMDKQAVVLAEALRAAGYHTLMSGKWHLGGQQPEDADRRPRARGFDRFFGIVDGAADYFEPKWYRLDDDPYTGAAKEYGDDFYATRAISDYAVRFVREARDEDERPFFLYVAYTAPHHPLQAPHAEILKHRRLYQDGNWEAVRQARYRRLLQEGLIDESWRYTALAPEDRAQFDGQGWAIFHMARVAATSSIVDQGVGQIVAALRELGELDDTLIVYLSDNGPSGFHSFVGAAPLTGGKRLLTEGGLATHLVLHWPGGIRRPGRIERRPGHVIDLMPTFLELAGVPGAAPGIDGRSLVPVLEGRRWRGHELLFWELYGQQAVTRDARWKYLLDLDGEAHLYDLKADPAETVDLAATHARKLRGLTRRYERWAGANNVLPAAEVQAWRQTHSPTPRKKQRNKGL